MKKILLTSLFAFSIGFVNAQTNTEDNLFFTNLYPRGGLSTEPQHYHMSTSGVGFGGQNGLDIKWWGGVKLRSAVGLLYLQEGGSVGINTESPSATLDVNGSFKVSNNSGNYFIYNSGDLVLKVASRTSNINSHFRAVVHDEGDILTLNYGSDYIGGTKIAGGTFIKNSGDAAFQGKIEAREIKVTQTPTADFVFEEDYDLPSLEAVEKHIKEKKHLPEIASAKEMEKTGVNIGNFQIKLLQKIEELTLYVIEQNNKIKLLETKIKNYENQK